MQTLASSNDVIMRIIIGLKNTQKVLFMCAKTTVVLAFKHNKTSFFNTGKKSNTR